MCANSIEDVAEALRITRRWERFWRVLTGSRVVDH
jgi:hypothetical protein